MGFEAVTIVGIGQLIGKHEIKRERMIPTSTIGGPVEFTLRLIGVWPNSSRRFLMRVLWTTAVATSQFLQHWYSLLSHRCRHSAGHHELYESVFDEQPVVSEAGSSLAERAVRLVDIANWRTRDGHEYYYICECFCWNT